MIIIYSNNEIVDIEWISALKFPSAPTITHNFLEYIVQPAQYKLAFIVSLQNHDYQIFEDRIQQFIFNSNLVFCIDNELHGYNYIMWQKYQADNVYWCMPGQVNNWASMSSNLIFWGDWFKTTTAVYKALPEQLAKLHSYRVKEKSFDALLGSPKIHRDWVSGAIKKNQLQEQIITCYGGTYNESNEFYAKDYFIWEENCIPQWPDISSSSTPVYYHGYQCMLSHVIPVSVYNDTAYSIITETGIDNNYSFYTEKTAKAIIGRRLFVVFSGYNFLSNLRALGFKTFGNIIDESYDLEIDNETRWNMAFEQVINLCQQPQQQVLDKLQPILEHNFELIMQTNWNQRAIDQIQEHINLLMEIP